MADVQTLKGRITRVTVMKDTTIEAITGAAGGLGEDSAGKAFQMAERMINLIKPHTPTLKALGPHVDVWRLVPTSASLELCSMFLSRYLCTVKPLFVPSWSDITAYCLRFGALGNIPIFDTESQETFYSGVSPAQLDQLPLMMEDEPPTFPRGTYLHELGMLVIFAYGSGETDLALTVATRHPGSIKYDPILAALRMRLQFLLQVLIEIVSIVVACYHLEHSISRTSRVTLENQLNDIRSRTHHYDVRFTCRHRQLKGNPWSSGDSISTPASHFR
ncbi:hypothetical protein BD410DRAFT_202749 [Rickenella mellea]|uniref:Uncharacterized protein n=1 Tax=Rickenella mellea TaxID=50990 RepID=A0A4Y7Q6M2_9AGAM|nr:hypothetical protein BD410DRAFT_202749 [Rickenella mellea]